MDVYGLPSPDMLRVDELLDFSNDTIFSSSSDTSSPFPTQNPSDLPYNPFHTSPTQQNSFDLCVPSDDAAHLEWLSHMVDDSFYEYPANPLTMNIKPEMSSSFTGKPRSQRSRTALVAGTWAPTPESELCHTNKLKRELYEDSVTTEVRRCTHCASEKTPQWRTGPLGPKTLCNACGVRFKSGRLVPEYRPASSPTFVLTQHSNSHRKVMELRRQKEQLESVSAGIKRV